LSAEQFDDAVRMFQKAAQTKPDDARGKEGSMKCSAVVGRGRGSTEV